MRYVNFNNVDKTPHKMHVLTDGKYPLSYFFHDKSGLRINKSSKSEAYRTLKLFKKFE